MSLMTGIALLVRCGTPGIDGRDFALMTRYAGGAALRLAVEAVATRAVVVLATAWRLVFVAIGAGLRRPPRRTMPLVTSSTVVAVRPQVAGAVARFAAGDRRRKLMRLVAGDAGLMRGRRSGSDEFRLFAMTTRATLGCLRRCMRGVARAADAVLRSLGAANRFENGLVTGGALLGGAFILVWLVAKRAFLVTVRTLCLVAGWASRRGILTAVAAVATQAVLVRLGLPRRKYCLYRLVTLDAECGFGPEGVRLVAPRTPFVARCKLRLRRLADLAGVAPNAKLGGLRSRSMDRVALGTIAMSGDIGFDMLIDHSLVAGRTITAVAAIGGIGSVRFVAQPTRIDIAVNHGRSDGLGLRR